MFGTTNSKFSIPAPSFHISTQTQRTQDTSDISLENLSAPSGVSLAGSEDDDEEGVLPYSQRNSRKRSRLKEMDGSPQSGEIDEDYDSLASVAIVEKFELLPRCDRHQPDLNASESKFIWSLAQRLAHDKKLVRAQIGARRGLCGAVLDNLGQNLKVHEIIRVDVPASTGLDMKFLKNLLPDLLDCVVVKVKGRTLTLYRDTSLPPVHRRLQASDSAEQDINEVVKRA
ncbi:hypothetical protein CEUSTIGMA_g6621.t1 [Chlamydomonas eustigma]|uniref:CRM domain-containing protein n=1 Tax=Chlamydomonas eustigma TaxID=1157962 RepID=A0A250X7W7_9CHLO|nr:hypothetical protein CEUSTIGMA_g6621.t1 [Chlamydomonas eustigma]|eukprot:GAX79181.1 hypothetical protein CEUSTIGMA_g6621.t1 [Chlamydomonas eustigma]